MTFSALTDHTTLPSLHSSFSGIEEADQEDGGPRENQIPRDRSQDHAVRGRCGVREGSGFEKVSERRGGGGGGGS
jgi:hypothetical protein